MRRWLKSGARKPIMSFVDIGDIFYLCTKFQSKSERAGGMSGAGNNFSKISDEILHRGVVVSVEDNTATVRVENGAECRSCAAAALCNHTGNRSNVEITVKVPKGMSVRGGEKVEVGGTELLHRRAIRLATLYPTLAILAVMTGVYLLTASQPAAALAGLGGMIFFFLLLWIFRKRLERDFSFQLKKVISAVEK